jgi:hypothetical protein
MCIPKHLFLFFQHIPHSTTNLYLTHNLILHKPSFNLHLIQPQAISSMLVFWPHSVFGQNHLCVRAFFRRLCTAKKIEDFRFPLSRPDDVSSLPDAHLSTVPSVRTTCSSRPDDRQTSIIRPDDVSFPSGPYTVSRSFCSSLHSSGPLSSPSGRLSILEQSQILSKFSLWED